MAVVGYGRVSSRRQDLSLQRAAFKKAGVRKVYEEKRGGGTLERPALELLFARLQPGDVVVVWKLDRLARSLYDLLTLLRRIESGGCALRSLTEPVDTSTPIGRLLVGMLGVIAEFELSLIRERVAAGKAEARARGSVFGRKRLVDYGEAARLRARGLAWADVGEALGVSDKTARNAVYRLRAGRASLLDPRRKSR